ncbi:MAG: SDR family NAD(P)-dependent oxidoreductase [Desulfobacterales bacterium]|nr:SDR family NAD(P)-dependent oxidoreductase [Desulfobacterales bacterium]MBF0395296.1 SDR family NAD(P)-dependent oxidoreductase [Desulfobacterales bacterium]
MAIKKDDLSPTKQMLVTLKELQAKLSIFEKEKHEPIAVVGIGCRFPGDSDTPDKFWQFLSDKKDAVTEIPKDRFDIDDYYDPNMDSPGKIYVRSASFLKKVDEFDADFFGITAREAIVMDPQQRLLLEVCWEAVESSGRSPLDLIETKSGVFIGAMTQDYVQLASELSSIDLHTGTGNSLSVLAGRISYILGLYGPAMTMDTACSSSLLSVHLACQSLRHKECDIALAGGVGLLLMPLHFIVECRTRMLSPDGICKTFDASANGYGRGEGCGIVMLKRLSDAVSDNDNILALIRGSAVNQDGRTSGLTVPNELAQENVIRLALESAKVLPEDISYIEAHGTGTPLGDPIEIGALSTVFKDRTKNPYLYVGSVKSNIGHLEGAAGIASLIKTILMLKHKKILPHLNFKNPNPLIPWDDIPVRIPTELIQWDVNSGKRLAGVSSFSFSGTNVHMILEEPETPSLIKRDKMPQYLLTLSAVTEASLRDLAFKHERYLKENPNADIFDICWTAFTGRTHFQHRLDILSDSSEGFQKQLAQFDTLSSDDKSYQEWSEIYKNNHGNRISIPTYPFQRKRYWIKKETVSNYYNALSDAQTKQYEEKFLTFGIFPEKVPEFSWILAEVFPEKYPNEFSIALEAQKLLRDLLFAKVNFSSCSNVLDFGCGYGSDLISLGKSHKHLKLTGYTISGEQAQIASKKVSDQNFEDRIKIFNKDSASDDFPEQYDFIFGFEVAHHIKNKKELFSNIGNHLLEKGLLVLADFISNADFEIEYHELSSYFIRKEEWASYLSENNLKLIEGIDVSYEISNFLYDPDFNNNMDKIKNIRKDIKSSLKAYNQLGKMLEKKLASYVLLTSEKRLYSEKQELYRENLECLSSLRTYTEKSLSQWLYKIEWRHKPLLVSSDKEVKTWKWLIFSDNKGFGEQISKNLEAKGHHCIQILQNQTNSYNYEKISGLIYLWGLNSDEPDDIEISNPLLKIVQELIQLSSPLPDLWIITHQVHITEDRSNFMQAPLWGFGLSIMQEHPEINCRCIDIDSQLEVLTEELCYPDKERQIVFNKGNRYAARLCRYKPEENSLISFKSDASYLITGGMGGLGLEVAKWMAQKGAGFLVLAGRNSPSDDVKRKIADIEKSGAKVVTICADISNKKDVSNILDKIKTSLPKLKGIIHAAGITQDRFILEQTAEKFEKVMSPKIKGAWNLHVLTKDIHLDFFISFSSIASMIGSRGQANYCAANAFLDALAHYRQSINLPALSINWGPWADIGMAAKLNARMQDAFSKSGMNLIDIESGLKVMELIFGSKIGQVGVFPLNWTKFFNEFPVDLPLFEDFQVTQAESEFIQKLKSIQIAKRSEFIINYLKAEIAKIMCSESLDISQDINLFDLGFDSLMALEFRNKLQKDFACKVSSTIFSKDVTIKKIADYVKDEPLSSFFKL